MPDRREDAEENPAGHRSGRTGMITLLVVLLLVPAAATVWDSVRAEGQAPDFQLVDTGFRDGTFQEPQAVDLRELRGQTVVIDFMAYNCGACRWTTPNLIDPLYERFHQDDRFTLLSIDAGEFSNFPGSNHDNLVKWQQEFESPWPHALDTTGVFLDYLKVGAFGLPAVFVIDGDGDIVHVLNGRGDLDEVAGVVEASLAGKAESVQVLQVGVVGLALVAGLASFFAPCSVGLIPAYMGFLLNRGQTAPASAAGGAAGGGVGRPSVSRLHAIMPGLQTASGIVAIYAVLAVAIWLASDALGPVLPYMGIIVGSLLVLLGLLLFVQFDWERIAKVFGMGKIDGRRGFFVFGIGYGLAAFGCTGPIFLPILIAGFAEGGAALGFIAFLVYSLAVATLVVFAAYLVSAGQQTRLRRLLSHTKVVTRISAVLLIGAGAYVLWFDLVAFGYI